MDFAAKQLCDFIQVPQHLCVCFLTCEVQTKLDGPSFLLVTIYDQFTSNSGNLQANILVHYLILSDDVAGNHSFIHC